MKLLKEKDRESLSKKRESTNHVQGILNKTKWNYAIGDYRGQKLVGRYIHTVEIKDCQQRILYPKKLSFKNEGEVKNSLINVN